MVEQGDLQPGSQQTPEALSFLKAELMTETKVTEFFLTKTPPTHSHQAEPLYFFEANQPFWSEPYRQRNFSMID